MSATRIIDRRFLFYTETVALSLGSTRRFIKDNRSMISFNEAFLDDYLVRMSSLENKCNYTIDTLRESLRERTRQSKEALDAQSPDA